MEQAHADFTAKRSALLLSNGLLKSFVGSEAPRELKGLGQKFLQSTRLSITTMQLFKQRHLKAKAQLTQLDAALQYPKGHALGMVVQELIAHLETDSPSEVDLLTTARVKCCQQNARAWYSHARVALQAPEVCAALSADTVENRKLHDLFCQRTAESSALIDAEEAMQQIFFAPGLSLKDGNERLKLLDPDLRDCIATAVASRDLTHKTLRDIVRANCRKQQARELYKFEQERIGVLGETCNALAIRLRHLPDFRTPTFGLALPAREGLRSRANRAMRAALFDAVANGVLRTLTPPGEVTSSLAHVVTTFLGVQAALQDEAAVEYADPLLEQVQLAPVCIDREVSCPPSCTTVLRFLVEEPNRDMLAASVCEYLEFLKEQALSKRLFNVSFTPADKQRVLDMIVGPLGFSELDQAVRDFATRHQRTSQLASQAQKLFVQRMQLELNEPSTSFAGLAQYEPSLALRYARFHAAKDIMRAELEQFMCSGIVCLIEGYRDTFCSEFIS
jgi:hypothetical protein